ncbi:FadR/GntR family transcriptional regulator [Deinococcus cellulosilyticus]|uniref:GntR family transcriptional regulator n=1 Tax=Deinococcus cellulosilyticus (strain DSM 18568 / NBRC 106333 / KACC 11606 / 5516J-15) TaxID=1223518 RepID=A0A511N1X2_DEIC1|nr:FadR/GntR family transcriptional regulator [Deinococcus cellulosilyticus]GEM46844.1 GntR family transcriptional regulator [Deinococcus cellulosilyticus NBRC 106333 = KACC 11606]
MPFDPPFEPLARQHLGESVAQKMADWIQQKRLLPGDRLPSENELIERFGVARTVIREAIAKLRALGIVEVYQGKGAFVAELPIELLLSRIRRLKPSRDGGQHLWEVREMLELQVVALATERCSMTDIATLEQALEQERKALEQGSNGADEDAHFHLLLAKSTHNPVLEDIVAEILGWIAPMRKQFRDKHPERRQQAHAELREVLDGIKEGDALKAQQAMKRHLDSGFDMLE